MNDPAEPRSAANVTDLFGVPLPEGRAIIGWGTLVIAIYIALTLGTAGVTERSVSAVVRWTGRISMLIFLAAYLRPALVGHSADSLAGWAYRNAPCLLVFLASSHTIHGAAIAALAYLYAPAFGSSTLIIGGAGYLFIYILAVKAIAGRAAASVEQTGGLERIASHYVWFVFTVTTAASIGRKPETIPFVMAAFAAAYARYKATRSQAL